MSPLETPNYASEGVRPSRALWSTIYWPKGTTLACYEYDAFAACAGGSTGWSPQRFLSDADTNIGLNNQAPWYDATVFERASFQLSPYSAARLPLERLAMAGREDRDQEELEQIVSSLVLMVRVNYSEGFPLGPLWAGNRQPGNVWHFDVFRAKAEANANIEMRVSFGQLAPPCLTQEYVFRACLTGYAFEASYS